jgi:Bacterial transglutaminase-like N-terminal region
VSVIFEIVHRTRYAFHREVQLDRHRRLFRPRGSHDLRVLRVHAPPGEMHLNYLVEVEREPTRAGFDCEEWPVQQLPDDTPGRSACRASATGSTSTSSTAPAPAPAAPPRAMCSCSARGCAATSRTWA